MTTTAIPESTGEVVNAEVVLYDTPPDEPEPDGEDDGGKMRREDSRREQLRFDVGGNPPNHNSLKVTADLSIEEPLRKGSEVRVQIIDGFGVVIATSAGKVISVNFKDEYSDGYITGTDRIHTVKL